MRLSELFTTVMESEIAGAELIEETTYYYWIENVDYSGNSTVHNSISVSISASEENPEPATIIEKTGLISNYPNPFNPSTVIRFSVSPDAKINLTVYDIKGKLIKRLISEKSFVPNKINSVVWNGIDENGSNVSSGVYLYQLSYGKHKEIKSILLLK